MLALALSVIRLGSRLVGSGGGASASSGAYFKAGALDSYFAAGAF